MSKKFLTEEVSWLETATRFRYCLPILAELQREDGCKFVFLMRRLQASDRAIRAGLDWLIEQEWVERNPGYGHHSRPEYILTAVGRKFAVPALSIWNELAQWSCQDTALERWGLPILSALEVGQLRFSEVRRKMPRCTPRALSFGLQSLIESGLVARTVVDSAPPSAIYELTKWGQRVAELCRLS